ncbi:phage tail tape measure protein [Gluconobacter morbifer]|uniref:Phage tail tape measure protein domain-containing protein n=1 Tax=Gluconobacter morbifer G707 TaxID=1088869 RepID=G6XKW6_9PROT|nr:phage tail tape measure protein [Gluconobacter morbifer]EHH67561.1 hypothetical protein GMO_21320 [Gluconobacter morbifer G707]
MSGSLTAQFELTLVDQMSAPIEKIEQILGRLNTTLDRMGHNPAFDEVWEPVPRCVEQTTTLTEALEQATSAATALDAALSRTGTGSGTAVTGLDAVTAAAQRTAEAVNRMPMPMPVPGMGVPRVQGDSPPEEEEPERPGYGRRVWGATQHFHEATERSIGQAFGAAAAGFGLVEPVKAAAEYDNTIRHIGIGLDLHGAANDAFTDSFGTQMARLARATGQKSEDLAESAGFLSREQYNREQINAVLPVIAQISTAYNAHPDAVAKSAFSLQKQIGVTDAQLGGALASVAIAGKSADLPFETLAPLLPQAAAIGSVFGMHGRQGVDDLATSLAVIRKYTGSDGHAVTDFTQLVTDLNSGHTAKRLSHYGIDMYGIEEAARHRGADPLVAIMAQIDRITRHGSDARVLGDLFRNQQSYVGAAALLGDFKDYQEIHRRTSGANQSIINQDYLDGTKSLRIQTQAFDESWEQLERRIGVGFAPILHDVTTGFHGLTEAMESADKTAPGLTTGIMGLGGAALASVAGMGALGAVAGPLRAGFGIVTTVLEGVGIAGVAAVSELAIVGAAVGVVGYEIYHNWDRITGQFSAFEHWVSGWSERVSGYVSGAFSHAFPQFPGSQQMSGPLIVPTTGPGWHTPMRLEVRHDPGLKVTAAPHPSVHTTVLPSGGRTLNRP